MLKNTTTYLFSLLLLCPFNIMAEDNSWSNVFKFQTKMAESGSVHAQFILGEMYQEGRGVKKNYVKAIQWYTKAQSSGDTRAAKRIIHIKKAIAQEKLNKKLAVKKHAKKQKKKTISPKKITTNKATVINKSETKKQPNKLKSVSIPIVKKQKKVPKNNIKPTKNIKPVENVKKEPRKHTSPEDFSRGAGTHLDDSEDPFD